MSVLGAGLVNTNLQFADLSGANLRGASLMYANLRGTKFETVDILGKVWKAQLDEETILPDGSKYDPEKGLEQLEPFTNPEHPNFWKPEV